jgi:DNA-binding transcriptional MerR regulator
MTQWYVKELSKLTGVSVQTLHHYDRIDLLNPSVRLANGYRLYSEKDLLQVQQIIALKFFGFELSQIKALLTDNAGALENFCVQAQILEKKANTLFDASKALKKIIAEVKDDKSIPWESIIQLIEVYRMTQALEKTWAGTVFTPDELKQYAKFQADLESRSTPEDIQNLTQNWLMLMKQVKEHLNLDPTSDFGLNLAKQVMDLVCGMYGKEHANIRNSIWQKGFKKGKLDDHRALEPEVVEWLDKAINHYYRERVYHLLDQIELGITPDTLQKWNDLINEMCGDSLELKEAFFTVEVKPDDPRIGPHAKKWLEQFIKPFFKS